MTSIVDGVVSMPKGQSPFDVKMLTINVMVQRVRDCVYL